MAEELGLQRAAHRTLQLEVAPGGDGPEIVERRTGGRLLALRFQQHGEIDGPRRERLAGELGVQMFDSLQARNFLSERGDDLVLTDAGRAFATDFGIDVESLGMGRRPLCKACLDWSARRSHLAGALGSALLDRLYELGWAKRETGTRVVRFSKRGEASFLTTFAT